MSKAVKLNIPKAILAVLFIIAVTFALHSLDLGKIGTMAVIPIGFMYFFLTKPTRIKKLISVKPVAWYLAFFIFASISILYAIDANAAVATQKKMLIVMLFSLAVFAYALNSEQTVKVVYIANAITLFLLIGYVLKLGINTQSDERIEDSVLNANTYGYYVFTGLFSLFILYSSRTSRKQKVMYMILTILACIFSFWLVLASASRGASIILGLLIVGNVFVITSASKKGMLQKALVSILLIVGLFYLANYVTEEYIKDSYLLQRFNDLEGRESPRQFHARKAFEIGSENPFIGVGAGNYAVVPKAIEPGSFSHNTFTEAFANHGIIGLFMYLLMLFAIVWKARKNLKTKNKKIRIITYQVFLFFLVFVIYNTLYIVYLSTIFMHFLLVIYAHLLLLERQVKIEKVQKINRTNHAV